ncbi:MAG: DoxX family protein [Methylothermaceae bacterium]|nr:DoxX family protein [Methylothermaceae bacterium]
MNETLHKSTDLIGRIFMAIIFLTAGLGKIGGYAATQAYMESAGVPGMFLPLVILIEAGGALALIVGWQTRIAALVLAGFSVLSALLFHADFGEKMQMILFQKNIAIAGGFLILALHGPGSWSLDAHRTRD